MNGDGTRIKITINNKEYVLDEAKQTGSSLKQLAGIPLGDVLFLQAPCDDQVIPNEAVTHVRPCDVFHSQPPADYGFEAALLSDSGLSTDRVQVHPQDNGWTFLVVDGFRLPGTYQPQETQLLIKLPPLFPEAAPDMFWVKPAVRTAAGASPRNTTSERLLGASWQRFSWHLKKGAWKPGSSTLRDFLRCVRARLARND